MILKQALALRQRFSDSVQSVHCCAPSDEIQIRFEFDALKMEQIQ